MACNNSDRRLRRQQGTAVGAAASKMRAVAKQMLGAATRISCLRRKFPAGWPSAHFSSNLPKISNYFFGLISVSLYAYVSYTYKLYGEMMLNLLVYVPVQFIGFYMWRRHMTRENTVNPDQVEEVVAKSLGFSQWVWVVAAAVIGTLAYTELLKSLGSALPALDGATVVISIVAQVLMVLRYREQWVLWIVVNILTISLWAAMWLHHGETSLPLLVMYGMYLCNSLYGYYNWTQLLRRHRTGHAF